MGGHSVYGAQGSLGEVDGVHKHHIIVVVVLILQLRLLQNGRTKTTRPVSLEYDHVHLQPAAGCRRGYGLAFPPTHNLTYLCISVYGFRLARASHALLMFTFAVTHEPLLSGLVGERTVSAF